MMVSIPGTWGGYPRPGQGADQAAGVGNRQNFWRRDRQDFWQFTPLGSLKRGTGFGHGQYPRCRPVA